MKTYFKHNNFLYNQSLKAKNKFLKNIKFYLSLSFNKNPSECYYKVLNSSPSSHIDDIKKEYELKKKQEWDSYLVQVTDSEVLKLKIKMKFLNS